MDKLVLHTGPSLAEVAAGHLRDRMARRFVPLRDKGGDEPPTVIPDRAPLLARIEKAVLFGIALALVLAAGTGISASVLLLHEDYRNRIAAREAAPKLQARAAHRELAVHRDAIATIMERETVTGLLSRFAAHLPTEARMTAVGQNKLGGLSAEIALPDPDMLNHAFDNDARLRNLVQSRQWSDGEGRFLILMKERTP